MKTNQTNRRVASAARTRAPAGGSLSVVALAFGLIAMACVDDGGSASGPGQTEEAVEIIPPGDECERGGARIETGSDENGNGVLDEDEVQGSVVVCNGGPGESGDPGEPGAPGDDGTDALADISTVQPGDDCPEGGVAVASGHDDNGNGELDGDEVEHEAVYCNGEAGVDGQDGTDMLSQITDVAPGDGCTDGGYLVSVGLDNGDGDDGVAGDGVLQDGEIDDESLVCDGEPALPSDDAVERPTGDPGTAVIDGSGGTGEFLGGSGGDWTIQWENGTGGDVELYQTGAVEVDVSIPDFEASLGTFVFEVDGDETVQALNISAETPTVGQVYTVRDGNGQLFVETEDGPANVSSVDVAVAAALTFEANTAEAANIRVERGITNAGTITAEYNGLTPFDLDLEALWYEGLEGSSLALPGNDSGQGPGGDGGTLTLDLDGRFINAGTIDLSGGDGTSGGSGGLLNVFYPAAGTTNTGAVTATGGVGSVGSGGDGGSVTLQAAFVAVENAGNIDVSGGRGNNQGGSGGAITLYAVGDGDVLNSGDLTARGGQAGDTCVTIVMGAGPCEGGAGGNIWLEAWGGWLRSSGQLDARGGMGGSFAGGSGGMITFHLEPAPDRSGDASPIGNLEVSGDLLLAGGGGPTGGSGGTLTVFATGNGARVGGNLRFFGYQQAVFDGGSGDDGGSGGFINISQHHSVSFTQPERGPAGAIVNDIDMLARGGHATTGTGGSGGSLDFFTTAVLAGFDDDQRIENNGTVNLRGGDSELNGGTGGTFRLYGPVDVVNTGSVIIRGGSVEAGCVPPSPDAGLTTPCSGGSGGSMGSRSVAGDAVNVGDVTATGGSSPSGVGGSGTFVELRGELVVNSGNVDLSGGDGSSGDGGVGGNGGDASFEAFAGPSEVTGSVDVSAGSGGTSGNDGLVLIDGAPQF